MYWNDIFRVPDLPLMRLLEILLKLVQLTSQYFTLIFNFIQLASHVHCIPESILFDDCLTLRWIQIDNKFAAIVIIEAP